ncbi:M48 family metallopeptidase [Candidatus Omnitrophota bacterium]
MDDDLRRAKAYSRSKHYAALTEMLVSLGFFIFIIYGGFSAYVAGIINRVVSNGYLGVMLYVCALGALLSILTFPLDLISSYSIEHKFGLSKQNLINWLKDYLKKLAIGAILYSIVVIMLYALLRNTPRMWWVCAGLGYFILSVVLAKIFPVLIIPLFYKLDEIQDESLKERILRLAKSVGANVLDVYRIVLGAKTKKANAAVCGLGSTKRILLSDTLIQQYDADEIEATLAHELSHHKFNHFWKLSLYNFIFTLSGFFLANVYMQRILLSGRVDKLYDFTMLPILGLIFFLYNFMVSPIMNLISRKYEIQADIEAINITQKPSVFASLMKKLTLQNLSDPDPSPLIKILFYDHPTAKERIGLCGVMEKKFTKS